MFNLLLLIALSCPATKIVNRTEIWNERDQDTLDRAKVRCGQIYRESPCLKYFEKTGENAYRAVCGKGE